MSDGFDFLDGLEHDLVAAARRRRDASRAARVARLRQRLGLRGGGLALLLLACVGVASAGATYAVLRAAVIEAPAARDVPPEQQPAAGSAHVSELRAPDPVAGRPPWTLRLARSSTGLLCTTAGQLVGGRFGLIGLDGRFRAYDERIVDSCGERVAGPHASLVGARVFDAATAAEVRTVVSGIGGPRLRSASLLSSDGARAIPLGNNGTFVTAVRGYPEDRALELVLRFAGGGVERHGFGRGPNLVLDPLGDQAWRAQGFGFSGERGRTCVSFMHARGWGDPPQAPPACGLAPGLGRLRDRWFFTVRRLSATTVRPSRRMAPFGRVGWGDAAPRTALWGAAGGGVRRLEVRGPGVAERVEPRGQSLLLVLPPAVDPASLTVAVVFADGHVVNRRVVPGAIDSGSR